MMGYVVAIAGASGVVGQHMVRMLLERGGDVERVVAVGRRALTQEHERLESVVVDVQSVGSIEAALGERVDVGFCALGTTMKRAGSKEAFRAVDYDAVLAFARAVLARGGRRFVVVTSIGSDAGSSNFYLRVKGEVEQALGGLGFEELVVLRPSMIDDEGSRADLRFGERVGLPISKLVFAVVGKRHRYAPIKAETIARAGVVLGLERGKGGVQYVESDVLHELGGLASG